MYIYIHIWCAAVTVFEYILNHEGVVRLIEKHEYCFTVQYRISFVITYRHSQKVAFSCLGVIKSNQTGKSFFIEFPN